MTFDEALELFEQWERERRSGSAYKAGFAVADELRRLRGEASSATSNDAVGAARITELEQSLAGLCIAIGIAPNPDEPWPDYLARVKAAMEQPGAAPSEGDDQGMGEMHFHYPGSYEISIRLEDPSTAGRFDEVNAKLDKLLQKVTTTMSFIDDLRTEVERTTTLEQSAITLIQGLSQQISDAAGNEAAVRDLASQLSSQADALAAALPANTSDDTGSATGQTTA